MTNVSDNICVQIINSTIIIFIPYDGNENLSAYFCNASLKTLVSCTEPGHPATTKVNTTITF
jgi:hypothetical protein